MNQLTDTTNPPISGIEIDAIFGAITLTVDSSQYRYDRSLNGLTGLCDDSHTHRRFDHESVSLCGDPNWKSYHPSPDVVGHEWKE